MCAGFLLPKYDVRPGAKWYLQRKDSGASGKMRSCLKEGNWIDLIHQDIAGDYEIERYRV